MTYSDTVRERESLFPVEHGPVQIAGDRLFWFMRMMKKKIERYS